MIPESRNLTSSHACPTCGSFHSLDFFTIHSMPVTVGELWENPAVASACPKGNIGLCFCETCGFIWNRFFDPSQFVYTQTYDNSLHFSPVYEKYARSTALRLIERYQLQNKKIVEIGCGKGDFLIMLCELGHNFGVGFDTSYMKRDIAPETAERVTFIQDYYSEQYSGYFDSADLICSRYVLEHIDNPTFFLKMIRKNMLIDSTLVYVEVPNVNLILQDHSVWDIIYEHCSYFNKGSLAALFKKCGFEIIELYDSFDEQFICIVASPAELETPSMSLPGGLLEKTTQNVETFSLVFQEKMNIWRNTLKKLEDENKKIIVWGAGAKGVSFLNMLQTGGQIKFVVDINPNKHDKYLAGTGQKIVPPHFLIEYRPDVIIIMNPIYEKEIKETINKMGLHCKFFLAS